MAWYSLLPPDSEYTYLESILIKTFIACGILAGGPGWSLVVYDFVVYCFRVLRFELLPLLLLRERGQRAGEGSVEGEEEVRKGGRGVVEEVVVRREKEAQEEEDGNITTSGSEDEGESLVEDVVVVRERNGDDILFAN